MASDDTNDRTPNLPDMRDKHRTAKLRREELMPVIVEKRIEGKSYRQISEETGVPKSTVHDWFKESMRRSQEKRRELTNQYLEQEAQRLENIIRNLHDAAARLTARDDFEEGDPDTLQEYRATMKEIRKTAESLRDLFGLDAPERVYHQHDDVTEYEVEVPGSTIDDDETIDADYQVEGDSSPSEDE